MLRPTRHRQEIKEVRVRVRVCACSRVFACACPCASACAPAGLRCVRVCLGWAVLYSGVQACYIRLRSGWGSDSDLCNMSRG